MANFRDFREFRYNHSIRVDADKVRTLVTNSSSAVHRWLTVVRKIHRDRLHRLVVGLDVEWRPNFHRGRHRNPVATLQLSAGRHCLIFQILHARHIPAKLHRFLSNATYTFVGVGIGDDVVKLQQDYGLHVANAVDLAPLAAERRGDPGLRNAGLKRLTKVVLGVVIDKPREIQTSAWDAATLSYEQVRYACADAFLSFEIGRVLRAWNRHYY